TRFGSTRSARPAGWSCSPPACWPCWGPGAARGCATAPARGSRLCSPRRGAVECFALMLTAAAGMSLLVVANSFVTVFVALELFSLCLYILVALDVDSLGSRECGIKYLIVGAGGAALLLYGSALVYGATGAFEFDRIAEAVRAG